MGKLMNLIYRTFVYDETRPMSRAEGSQWDDRRNTIIVLLLYAVMVAIYIP